MEPSKFAVLTSGGDAPGMNAAIRAIVRTGLHLGHAIVGVERGFQGLLEANFRTLSARDVGGIIQQGGTILGSSRCSEFCYATGVSRAKEVLESAGIRGLVVI
jgi:6-phosphofructokinase 1